MDDFTLIQEVQNLTSKYKTNDPFELASYLDITVLFSDLGKVTRGMYVRMLQQRYIIIHQGLDWPWRRFICAHELAHDRLHPGLNRFWVEEHSLFNIGKFEREANKFAVRLLIANDEFNQGDSIEEVLRRNGVPLEMKKFFL